LNSIPRPCGEQIRKKAFSGLLLSQYLPRNDDDFFKLKPTERHCEERSDAAIS